MRADYWLFALLGIANATSMLKRQDDGYEVDGGDYDPKYDPKYPEKDDGYKPTDPGYDADKGYDHDDNDNGYAAKSPDPYPAKKPYPTKPAYPTKDAYPAKPYPSKYPSDDYPSKDYPSDDDYKSGGYPTDDDSDSYSPKPYPPKPYPSKPYPEDDSYPTNDYPPKDYPTKDYPTKDYPTKDYPTKDYPTKDYPTKDYPTKDYPGDDYPTKQGHYDEYDENKGGKQPWHPKTEHPEFFSLRVDDKCDDADTDASDCPFDNYAIRLEKGIVIATPYNKWWDPKLPIFFVDDDTQLYTVSKQPLQLYIDTVTGSLRYAPVGWLPPDSIAYSFYKTGNNPLGKVDPSPASLSWPSTEGNTLYGAGPWSLCSLGNTGQFQVFVNADNYGGGVASGVWKDSAACKNESLAAINANPWKKGQEYPW